MLNGIWVLGTLNKPKAQQMSRRVTVKDLEASLIAFQFLHSVCEHACEEADVHALSASVIPAEMWIMAEIKRRKEKKRTRLESQ